MMAKLYLIFWICIFFSQAAPAYEFRVWETVNGDQFEGRFVKELFGKLTIESENGTIEIIEVQELSELDQKFIRTKIPPEIEAKVFRTSNQISPRPADRPLPITINEYQLKIEIKKKSQRPFTSRLKAELFMIAEEAISSDYVLMDLTQKEFIFPAITKNTTVEILSPWVKMQIYQGGYMGAGTRIGQSYAGYLMVISTMQGDIVYTDTSLRPWIEDPEVIKNLRQLWINGKASWVSRFFDKTGKKILPPRPPKTS